MAATTASMAYYSATVTVNVNFVTVGFVMHNYWLENVG